MAAAELVGGHLLEVPALSLVDALPDALLELVLLHVEHLDDLARTSATCRALRFAPLERALRARAAARGDSELPRALPAGAASWAHALLVRERRAAAPCGHSRLVACGGTVRAVFSAFVDARGGGGGGGCGAAAAGRRGGSVSTCGHFLRGHTLVRSALEAALGHGGPGPPTPPTSHAPPLCVPTPRPVAGPAAAVRMVAVAAGGSHLLLLSAAGRVYSCGRGGAGRLGHGDEEDQCAPRPVAALAYSVRVAAVAAAQVRAEIAISRGAEGPGEIAISRGGGERGLSVARTARARLTRVAGRRRV